MKKVQIIFISCFLIFIGVIGLATIGNKNEKSLVEGRALKQFPDMKYERFEDAVYFQEIADAFSDQVAGREKMISFYYDILVNKFSQNYVGDVSIGSESHLFAEPEKIADEEAYKEQVKNIATIVNQEAAKITETGAKFIFLNYPRKDIVETEYLPSYYPDTQADYEEYMKILRENLSEDAILIDAYEVFSRNPDTDYYYKTDHHVNIRGQQLVYEELIEIVKEDYPDIEVKTLDDYKITEQVVEGSFNRRVGNVCDAGKEELNIQPDGWELEYERNSKVPIFGKGNTYGNAFMGGDYALTTIETANTSAPDLMICGSSFSNSLESLCVPSFHNMVSVDFRYNSSGKTLLEYVTEYQPEYVIYTPSQSNKAFDYANSKLHLGFK